MTPWQKIIIAYVILINVLAYAIMCFDKLRSKQKGRRISENTLFTLAAFLGAVGIYLGMKTPLYHKAGKPKFKIGIPLLIMANIATGYMLLTTH